MAEQPKATVRCPDCGGTREITMRQKRRLTQEGRTFHCNICRTIKHPATSSFRHRNYWLKSQTMEWIRETAEMIWPEDHP